ncbi:putative F-box/LRR-repeat protein At3g18150 [Silene latifolia]|uniref:putative F-box/LRR-repeat protein At3g18150 n=1 Tax=Silene latifolia TaxID=37657 RepID=UPI003D772ACE
MASSDSPNSNNEHEHELDHESPPLKRMKPTNVDRITNLPDELITNILSLLPVKTLLSTQLLSKRWRYAWTSIPNLIFSQRENNSRHYDEVHLINVALKLHPGPLKKLSLLGIGCKKIEPGRKGGLINYRGSDFRLRLKYGKYNPSPDIRLWVDRAVSLKIEVLVLEVHDTHYYSLPRSLFLCDTLKEFRLSASRFSLGSSVFWKSLKKLILKCVTNLCSDKIHKIINGSPVLKSLKLKYCSGFSRIIVPSDSNLRNLVIDSCNGHQDYGYQRSDNERDEGYDELLEISGPSITSLEISGDMGSNECKLQDMSSLVEVSLKFSKTTSNLKSFYEGLNLGSMMRHLFREDRKPGSMMMHLLREISHVEKLSLGSWCTQVLSMCELENLCTTYMKCKILEIDSIYEESVPGIDRLLRSSPFLEKLTIYMEPYNYYDKEIDLSEFPIIDGENYWRSPEKAAIENAWHHLKVVKFVGFETIEGTFMLELAEYVLDNAKVLEKLVLKPDKGAYRRCHRLSEIKDSDLFNAMQGLLSYPKCSQNARVLLL